MLGWLFGAEKLVWAEIGAARDKKWARDVLRARRSDFPRGTKCRIRPRRKHFPIECHIPESLAKRMLRTGEILDYH